MLVPVGLILDSVGFLFVSFRFALVSLWFLWFRFDVVWSPFGAPLSSFGFLLISVRFPSVSFWFRFVDRCFPCLSAWRPFVFLAYRWPPFGFVVGPFWFCFRFFGFVLVPFGVPVVSVGFLSGFVLFPLVSFVFRHGSL